MTIHTFPAAPPGTERDRRPVRLIRLTVVLLAALTMLGGLTASARHTLAGDAPATAHPASVTGIAAPSNLVVKRSHRCRDTDDRPNTATGLTAASVTRLTEPALVFLANQQTPSRTEYGTGIVLTTAGLVMTNYHVIADSTQLYATAPGTGLTYTGQVIGTDPDHDLALVRLDDAEQLSTATLGDSDTVRVGDEVASIGDAYALGRPSVGIGPVTGLHRVIGSTARPARRDGARLRGLIQASTDIEPGESGGAMIDQTGEVIGINVAFATDGPDDETPNGSGYAIPINTAVAVANHMLDTDH